MNILYAAKTLTRENGGVCTHILDLCRSFSEANIVIVADGSDYEREIDSLPNVTYVQLPFKSVTDSVNTFANCYKALKGICIKHKIDIIHLHGQRYIPFAWLIKCTCGIPYLWTNHIDAIPQPMVFAAMAHTFRFPIISVSSDLKKKLVEDLHIPLKQIRMIPNGVDLSAYRPLSEAEKTAIYEKFGIQEHALIITELARLFYAKGQDLLIRAVDNVMKAHPELPIMVLFAGSGDTDWFRRCVTDYADANSIPYRYVGFQSPREVFGVSDLAVLPSIYEGFALVCTEAFAMECPVVRSDSPGHSDMSDVALIHRKGDQQDLTQKLEYAVTHLEEMKAMARAGRKKCEAIFNTEEMCRQTMKVYQEIIEGTF